MEIKKTDDIALIEIVCDACGVEMLVQLESYLENLNTFIACANCANIAEAKGERDELLYNKRQ